MSASRKEEHHEEQQRIRSPSDDGNSGSEDDDEETSALHPHRRAMYPIPHSHWFPRSLSFKPWNGVAVVKEVKKKQPGGGGGGLGLPKTLRIQVSRPVRTHCNTLAGDPCTSPLWIRVPIRVLAFLNVSKSLWQTHILLLPFRSGPSFCLLTIPMLDPFRFAFGSFKDACTEV
jgi:hypothetical protein